MSTVDCGASTVGVAHHQLRAVCRMRCMWWMRYGTDSLHASCLQTSQRQMHTRRSWGRWTAVQVRVHLQLRNDASIARHGPLRAWSAYQPCSTSAGRRTQRSDTAVLKPTTRCTLFWIRRRAQARRIRCLEASRPAGPRQGALQRQHDPKIPGALLRGAPKLGLKRKTKTGLFTPVGRVARVLLRRGSPRLRYKGRRKDNLRALRSCCRADRRRHALVSPAISNVHGEA